jgi:hypothetical protein
MSPLKGRSDLPKSGRRDWPITTYCAAARTRSLLSPSRCKGRFFRVAMVRLQNSLQLHKTKPRSQVLDCNPSCFLLAPLHPRNGPSHQPIKVRLRHLKGTRSLLLRQAARRPRSRYRRLRFDASNCGCSAIKSSRSTVIASRRGRQSIILEMPDVCMILKMRSRFQRRTVCVFRSF